MEAEDKREGVKEGTWITAILNFGENPGYDNLKKILEERLLSMTRFRSTCDLDYKAGSFHEVDLADIDWDYHLHVPDFAKTEVSEQTVLDFSGSTVCDNSIDLDIEKPLWRFFMFPKVRTPSGDLKTVVVMLVSHAIGDGVSLLGVLYRVSDNSPIDPFLPLNTQQIHSVPGKAKNKPKLGLWTRTTAFWGGVHEALFGVNGPFDPKTSLTIDNPSVAGRKLCGSAEDIPLIEIKKVKNMFAKYGMTVNDVLLTIMSMTLRAYFEETGELTPKLKLRSNFFVSLQSPTEPLLPNGNPRNKFGVNIFNHVMDYKSPIDCLFQIKAQTDKAKVSPQVPLSYKLGAMMLTKIPKDVMIPQSVKLMDRVASVISNVPGPDKALEIGGCEIEKLAFHAHTRAGVYIGVLSYNGQVSLSLSVDERLEIAPEKLLKHWNAQYKVLADEVDKFAKCLKEGESIPKGDKGRMKLLAA